MEVIEPVGHHEVVIFLLQLGLLLLVARTLGQVAVRFGLPSVVGELLAGVLLGPSVFGAIAPGAFAAVVPNDATQFHLLEVVSLLGVIMLLVVTGLETDVDLIVRKGRSAAAISLFGIAVPFATGFALGQVLPVEFVAAPDQRLVFSLFLGTAMGISAIPVIAKVLIEMGVVRRDIGQITLAAGMIDDTIGWILLSVVAGLARSGVVDLPAVAQSVLSVVLVVGIAFTAGRRAVSWLFRSVDNAVGGDLAKISLLMVLALLAGSLTHFLNIEAVLGAFLVGILAGQVKRFDRHARHVFETVTLGIFAPIFFAASGLRVDLAELADPLVFGVGVLALLVAIVGKFVGAAIGAKVSGLGRWEALSLGAGMNARGAIEIIVATIGLSLGILTPAMFTIILLIAIVTSLMAPPLLRWTLQRVPMSEEERERLAADERREASFLGNLHRVLLPTRGGTNSQLAARLLGFILAGEDDVEVTTLGVVGGARPAGSDDVEQVEAGVAMLDRHLETIRAQDRRTLLQHAEHDLVDTILEEVGRGYDLLALGATDNGAREADTPLFGGLVDRLVQGAPCPVFVVSTRGPVTDEVADIPLRRILLPTSGSDSGRHAAEVAFALARATGATVDIAHLIDSRDHLEHYTGSREAVHAGAIGAELVESLAAQGDVAGASVRTHLETQRRSAEQAMLHLADDVDADLIVLAASRRPLSQRTFFGHRVEYVLREARCPVLIVS